MNIDFVRERISALRLKKEVSEYKMSLDLGHSKSYIQSISSGRAVPSLNELLYICEYLGVTPKQFFDEETEEPELVNKLLELTRKMNSDDLDMLVSLAERLNEK